VRSPFLRIGRRLHGLIPGRVQWIFIPEASPSGIIWHIVPTCPGTGINSHREATPGRLTKIVIPLENQIRSSRIVDSIVIYGEAKLFQHIPDHVHGFVPDGVVSRIYVCELQWRDPLVFRLDVAANVNAIITLNAAIAR
jgi:hypothetical protein